MPGDLRDLPTCFTDRVQIIIGGLQGLRLQHHTPTLPQGRYKAVRVLQQRLEDTAGMGHYSLLLIPDDLAMSTYRLHAVKVPRETAVDYLVDGASLDFGVNGMAGVAVLERRDSAAPMGRGVNAVADRCAGMALSHADLDMLMTSRTRDGSFKNVSNCMAFVDMVFQDLADSAVQPLQDVPINDLVRQGSGSSPPATKAPRLRAQCVRPDTVLVIGGLGAGKSTLCNMLFNQSSTQLRSPFSTGIGAASVTKDLRAIFSAQSCRLIVDTIGAGDLHIGNHQIVAQIRRVFQQGAVGLCAIVLVVNMEAGLSRGDRANLELLSHTFDTHLKTHGVIVVTHFGYEANEKEARLEEWLGADHEARRLFGKFKSVIVTDNSNDPDDADAAALTFACLQDLNAHIESTRALPRAFADMGRFEQFVLWFFSFFSKEVAPDLQQVRRELAAAQSEVRPCCVCNKVTSQQYASDTACCQQWACLECQRGGNGLCCACGQPL